MDPQTKWISAKRWVLISGIINTVLALPFGLPFTYNWYTRGWIALGQKICHGGSEWIVPDEASGIIFMVLAGMGLSLVGLSLIYASGNLEERVGVPLLNGIVRIIFVIIALYHLIRLNGPYIMYSFVLIDLILGPVLLYYSLHIVLFKRKSYVP